MPQTYPALFVAALLLFGSGCAHEVIVLEPSAAGPEAAQIQDPPNSPLPLTVSVLPGSFDRCRLHPRGVLDRFAAALREAQLFQGVLFPVPADVRTEWEIEILAADSVSSNQRTTERPLRSANRRMASRCSVRETPCFPCFVVDTRMYAKNGFT